MNYYSQPIQVRFADTDAQGHVFFGNYLTYFDEAVSGLLRSLNLSYQTLRSQNLDFVYAHAECDYHQRAVFEDMLNVHVRAARIGDTSITFECNAHRASDDELIASGKLVVVMVDTLSGNKRRVPEHVRKLLHQEVKNEANKR
jgi:acyl-CoA thioester hydrolase